MKEKADNWPTAVFLRSLCGYRAATRVDLATPRSLWVRREPPGAHSLAAAHLEHQFSGKVERGYNPAPVEGSLLELTALQLPTLSTSLLAK